MYYFLKTRIVRSLATYIFTSVTLAISDKKINLFLVPFIQVFLGFTIKTIHMRKDLSTNRAWKIFCNIVFVIFELFVCIFLCN